MWKTADVKRRGFVVGNVGQALPIYLQDDTGRKSYALPNITLGPKERTDAWYVCPWLALKPSELRALPSCPRKTEWYLVKADGRAQTQNNSYPDS